MKPTEEREIIHGTRKSLIVSVTKEFRRSKTHKSYSEKEIKDIVECLIEKMAEIFLSQGSLEIRGLGSFRSVVRLAKVGRNPRKPKVDIVIPQKKTVRFSLSEMICEVLNG